MGSAAIPVFTLKAGNLYNATICLIVFFIFCYVAFSILQKSRGPAKISFGLFLFSLGNYWLAVGLGNILSWLDILDQFGFVVIFIKFLSALSPIFLIYYLSDTSLQNKTTVRRIAALYIVFGICYFTFSLRNDYLLPTVTYWGTQWATSFLPFSIFSLMLLPIALISAYSFLNIFLTNLFNKKSENVSIYLVALLYVLLEFTQIRILIVTWQSLLLRFFYILIAAAAYNYFSRTEEAKVAPRTRFPLFLRLLSIFILLSILPISIVSLLMYFSFKEITDIYVLNPILWNIKAGKSALLLALTHVQVQVLFLVFLIPLLLIIAAAIVARRISEPINQICSGMKMVQKGESVSKITKESNDEIGDLTTHFNQMSYKVNSAREIIDKWSRELEAEVSKRTKELTRTQEQLISLDKLKNEFVSNLSQELGLPLTEIEKTANILRDERFGGFNEDQKTQLMAIIHSTQRETALVNRLLQFSSLESGKSLIPKTPLDIHEVLKEFIAQNKKTLNSKKAQLTYDLGAKNTDFIGDKEKIIYAFSEALDNSLKFSEGPAHISIRTYNIGDQVGIDFEDKGIGIAQGNLDQIFNEFFQVDGTWTRKYGGTGLGLAVAKKIIAAHNGKIWAESEGEGRGTKIKINLPNIHK